MKRYAIKILVIGLLLYLIAMGLLYAFQRKVLYIPPTQYFNVQQANLSGVQEITRSDNKDSLLGWWSPPQNSDAPVIMFFHGNGSAVYSNRDIYADIQTQGFGLFALGYPGYPGTPGETTQQSLTLAAQQAYDYVRAQGVDETRIVFYGTSLGAGIAAQLSRTRRPAKIIMEANFTSASGMAQFRFPFFPSALLTKDKFYSDRALAKSDMPLLWLHGKADRVIPIRFGSELYESYNGPKRAKIFEGGHHTDLWGRGGKQEIYSFITEP